MAQAIWNLWGYSFSAYTLFSFFSGVLMLFLGGFVLYQNWKSSAHIACALVGLSCFVWLTGTALEVGAPSLEVSLLWMRYYTNYGVFGIAPSVYFFSAAFTNLKSPFRRSLIGAGFALAVVFSFLISGTDLIFSGMQTFYWGFWPKAGGLRWMYHVYFSLYYLASLWNFYEGFRREKNPIRRKQLGALMTAFSIGLLGGIDYLPEFGIEILPVGFVFLIAFVFVMFYSIIQYRLLDIETVIHKTTAWLLTSTALVLPLAGLLYFTRSWYAGLDTLGAWLYLGSVLLVFLLFTKTFHPKVDHFFQRGRYDLETVLNQFADELVHLRSVEEVIHKITDTIANTLYPQKVTVLVYHDPIKKLVTAGGLRDSLQLTLQLDPESSFLKWLSKNDRVLSLELVGLDPRYESVRPEAQEYCRQVDALLCLPLVLNEKLIGLVNLGRKTNLKRFTAGDYEFLNHLKNQATIALSNSLVYGRVEELVRIRTDQLMETQRQLVQAEKLATVGTLAGGVAHEINNPLAAILTNAQMLLMEAKSPDEKEALQLIEEATERCRDIVRKLMTYSRKSLGVREVGEVHLDGVVNNVISFLSFQLTQENIKLNCEFREGPFRVKGNQNELEQVFTNLILNARDAIQKLKRPGRIDISLLGTEDTVKAEVKDDGAGIAPEHLPKIFDPFFTTKDVGKGTGLGLSICQSILHEHGGTIEVRSREGEGSTFLITLPRMTHGTEAIHPPPTLERERINE